MYEKVYRLAGIEVFVREHRPEPPPIDTRAARFWAERRAEQIRIARIVTARTKRDAA